ncbi:MAG TPA: putative Ig domain-containing protein, partial [Gaiellaceae bacterium]|nr:putative Ig domain-containing protein [Gaiellaceae bacterium]
MRAIVPLLLVLAVVAEAGARQTALPQQRGHVDLLSHANVEIRGGSPSDEAGLSVAAAGDVNGDGLDDVVVGAPGADGNGRSSSGSAYVVFGRVSPSEIDLAALGDAGYRIDGAAAADRAGYAVAGLGDVNGDERADVLVGAHGADNNGRSNSGSAYVVFGKRTSATVDLAALAEQGFRVDGATVLERAGWVVAAAGDVNGDGLADALVGAPFADNNLRQGSGSAYVVFGKRSSATVDLAVLGDDGFRIDGAAPQDFTSEAMAAAGDLNGDGLGDVLVGATFADNNERPSSGSAYVVYGTRTGASVDLAALGARGFRIDGASGGDGAGAALAARDLNGDGLGDVLVGAVFADNNGRQGSGSVYVVFGAGSSPNVDLGALGDQGLRIDGATAFDFAGGSVAALEDVNGDARADVLLGAAGGDNNGRHDSGSAYVVYLTGWRPSLDLGALGDRGFRMDGAGAGDSAGSPIAGAGDVNGDARADVLVGARGADRDGRPNSGTAYVVYGFGSSRLAYDPLVATVGRRVESHSPRIVRRTGPPRFSVSRSLPAGLRLDPATGVIAGTPVVFARRKAYTVTMTDLAGSVRAPLAIAVTDRSAPRLRLGGPAVQDVLRRRAVTVRASCSEPCRLSARGAIVVPGLGSVGLRRVRASLETARATRLDLSLSTAARKRLAGWLVDGRHGRATVVVHATDRAGNTSSARQTVAVRR